jgi:hypothetical protein
MYDRDYAACPANYYHDGPSTPNRDRNPRSDPIPGSWGSSPRRYHRDPRDPRCAHHPGPAGDAPGVGRRHARCSIRVPASVIPGSVLSGIRRGPFLSESDAGRAAGDRVGPPDSESRARRLRLRLGLGSGILPRQKHGPTRLSIRTGDSTTPCFRLGVLRVRRVFLSGSSSESNSKDARSD